MTLAQWNGWLYFKELTYVPPYRCFWYFSCFQIPLGCTIWGACKRSLKWDYRIYLSFCILVYYNQSCKCSSCVHTCCTVLFHSQNNTNCSNSFDFCNVSILQFAHYEIVLFVGKNAMKWHRCSLFLSNRGQSVVFKRDPAAGLESCSVRWRL